MHTMPLLRSAFPVACVSMIALFAACGGSVANQGSGHGADGGSGDDGGKRSGDAGIDANKKGDANVGCVVSPVVGAACSPEVPACSPIIDPCCPGYEWQCDTTTRTWVQDGTRCACPPDASAPDASTEVPTSHRPDDSQCATVPPAGDCGNVPDGVCTGDSDCTMGTNGRCNESTGGALFCSCQYDACAADTDCPSGQLCACHGSPYTGGDGNTCVQGNCRVDSDCGAGGYCSPSAGGGCGGLSGYYCHTTSDTCVNDDDCSSGGPESCQWSSTDERWECTQEDLCG
jgi:hypothetical protein